MACKQHLKWHLHKVFKCDGDVVEKLYLHKKDCKFLVVTIAYVCRHESSIFRLKCYIIIFDCVKVV